MDSTQDIFQAITGPTKREIIHLISCKPGNLTTLFENVDRSMQAVTLHIKIPEECGFIITWQQGRERYCKLIPEKFKQAGEWIYYYRNAWSGQFTSLKNYIDNQNKANRKTRSGVIQPLLRPAQRPWISIDAMIAIMLRLLLKNIGKFGPSVFIGLSNRLWVLACCAWITIIARHY